MKIKELRQQYNLSRQQFCEYFKIPYRTLQDWELGVSKCPEYLLELIEYKLNKEKGESQ
jgi:DNA-binding transcriptional regulator YiaG